MTKKKLNCIEEDCGYQTQEGEQDLALQLLTLHVNTQYAEAATTELYNSKRNCRKRNFVEYCLNELFPNRFEEVQP